MFTPPLLNKLPLKCRCSVNKIKYKPSLLALNFLEVYLSTYFFDKKPTVLTDHHIIGSNPIINLMIIYFIGMEAKKTSHNTTITLSIPSNNDYWNYSLVNDIELFKNISLILDEQINSYNEFLKFVTRKIPLNNIKILYQYSDIKWSRYDHYIDEFLFSFSGESNIFDKEKHIATSAFIIEENKIKNDLNSLMIEHFDKFDIIEKINNETTKELKVFSPFVHLSSFPDGWLNIATYQDNEKDNSIILSHHYSKMKSSYGSANKININPSEMRELSLEQIMETKNLFYLNLQSKIMQ